MVREKSLSRKNHEVYSKDTPSSDFNEVEASGNIKEDHEQKESIESQKVFIKEIKSVLRKANKTILNDSFRYEQLQGFINKLKSTTVSSNLIDSYEVVLKDFEIALDNLDNLDNTKEEIVDSIDLLNQVDDLLEKRAKDIELHNPFFSNELTLKETQLINPTEKLKVAFFKVQLYLEKLSTNNLDRGKVNPLYLDLQKANASLEYNIEIYDDALDLVIEIIEDGKLSNLTMKEKLQDSALIDLNNLYENQIEKNIEEDVLDDDIMELLPEDEVVTEEIPVSQVKGSVKSNIPETQSFDTTELLAVDEVATEEIPVSQVKGSVKSNILETQSFDTTELLAADEVVTEDIPTYQVKESVKSNIPETQSFDTTELLAADEVVSEIVPLTDEVSPSESILFKNLKNIGTKIISVRHELFKKESAIKTLKLDKKAERLNLKMDELEAMANEIIALKDSNKPISLKLQTDFNFSKGAFDFEVSDLIPTLTVVESLNKEDSELFTSIESINKKLDLAKAEFLITKETLEVLGMANSVNRLGMSIKRLEEMGEEMVDLMTSRKEVPAALKMDFNLYINGFDLELAEVEHGLEHKSLINPIEKVFELAEYPNLNDALGEYKELAIASEPGKLNDKESQLTVKGRLSGSSERVSAELAGIMYSKKQNYDEILKELEQVGSYKLESPIGGFTNDALQSFNESVDTFKQFSKLSPLMRVAELAKVKASMAILDDNIKILESYRAKMAQGEEERRLENMDEDTEDILLPKIEAVDSMSLDDVLVALVDEKKDLMVVVGEEVNIIDIDSVEDADIEVEEVEKHEFINDNDVLDSLLDNIATFANLELNDDSSIKLDHFMELIKHEHEKVVNPLLDNVSKYSKEANVDHYIKSPDIIKEYLEDLNSELVKVDKVLNTYPYIINYIKTSYNSILEVAKENSSGITFIEKGPIQEVWADALKILQNALNDKVALMKYIASLEIELEVRDEEQVALKPKFLRFEAEHQIQIEAEAEGEEFSVAKYKDREIELTKSFDDNDYIDPIALNDMAAKRKVNLMIQNPSWQKDFSSNMFKYKTQKALSDQYILDDKELKFTRLEHKNNISNFLEKINNYLIERIELDPILLGKEKDNALSKFESDLLGQGRVESLINQIELRYGLDSHSAKESLYNSELELERLRRADGSWDAYIGRINYHADRNVKIKKLELKELYAAALSDITGGLNQLEA